MMTLFGIGNFSEGTPTQTRGTGYGKFSVFSRHAQTIWCRPIKFGTAGEFLYGD